MSEAAQKRGIRLKALRVRLGLTQRRLAETLGVAHNTLSSWESGGTEPDIGNIVRLAQFFGVTIDYLLSAPGADSPQWVDEEGKRVDYPPEVGVAVELLLGLRKPVRRSVIALLPGFAVSVEEKITEARRRLEEKSVALDEVGITEE